MEEKWDHPAFPTKEAFQDRMSQLLRDEADNEIEWYYLSFAMPKGEGGFLGGLYIRANGEMTAISIASMLGINPGGEVLCYGPISDEAMDAEVPEDKRMRLLSAKEVNG